MEHQFTLYHELPCKTEKKHYLFMRNFIPIGFFALLGLLLSVKSYGQIASNYGFSASTGTYTALTQDTVVTPTNLDDGIANNMPLGFTFYFCGTPYTTVSANDNGFISFNAFPGTGYWDNFELSESYPPEVLVFWQDLNLSNAGAISYITTGTPGSRVYTIQYANVTDESSETGVAAFQIKLYEGTNVIQMCYGPSTLNDWNPNGFIGIANSLSDWQNLTNTTSLTTPTLSSTTFNNDIEVLPANGAIYTWTPPPPCATPAAQATALTLTPGAGSVSGSFTASSPAADGYLVIGTTTATPPANPIPGTAYAVGDNTLGGTVLSSGATTSFSQAPLQEGTQYWYWVYSYNNTACTGGPLYDTVLPLNGTTTTTFCSLAGTFVVGPTGDYNRIADAIGALMQFGQSGPVTLEIQTTYTGETAYPVTIGAIPCASAANNLVIRPQGALTITANGTDEVFDLNGAQYVTIDGRVGSTGITSSLTISDTSTSGADIRFINDASNNVVEYCTLLGEYNTGNTTNNSGTIFFSTALSTGNDNNRIDNCTIMDGATTPQVGIISLGTSGMENDHDTVSNCNIANYFSAHGATDGVLLSTGSSDWTIMNNKFYQTATRTFLGGASQRAIYINNTATGNNFTVTGNTIGYASSTGTGTYTYAGTVSTVFHGIYMNVGTTAPSNVEGNTITNISVATSSTANGSGGYLCGIDIVGGSVNVGDVSANTIGAASGNGVISGTTSGSGGAIIGISSSAGSPAVVKIENNIIGGITNAGLTASKSASIQGIQASSSAGLTISSNTIGNFVASTASTGSAAQTCYGINASTSNPDTITNNNISNLSNAQSTTAGLTSGILYTGSGAGFISNNTINNINGASSSTGVSGQTGVSGIAYTGSGAANIDQNVINTISNTNTASGQANVSGIGISTSANGIVQRNKIYDLRNSATGTSATAPPAAIGILCGSPGTGGQTITNNFISIGSSQTTSTEFVGLMSTGNSNNTQRFYYNSIDIEGTAASGALPTVGIMRGNNSTGGTTGSVDIKNNIVVNNHTGGTGENYAIANGLSSGASSNTNWGTNASNYNILNTTNPATVGYWGADQTFASWKTTSASDTNSYSATPVTFTNVTTGDLHINMGTTPNNIESHATPLALVTTDYDNDTRPGPQPSVNGGGLLPDIGADEFDGHPLPNLPPVITYTPLFNSCSTDDLTFSGNVTDSSGIPLTGSGAEPRVYYKKGTSGTWFSHAAALASGSQNSGAWNFTIVGTDMGTLAIGDTVFYYVIAQDNIGNITSNPAAGLVASNVTTVTTPPTTPNYYQIAANLAGTYTVGASGNYPTITAAVNAYSVACLNGPVIFQLTDATYPNETFPMVIGDNPQASAVNTLTIEPASGVAVSVAGSSSASAMFKLLNAQYVTIDGINTGGASLTLTSTNTGNNTANIWLASTASAGPGCRNIALNNMTLVGGSNGTTSDWCINASVDGGNPSTNGGMDNDTVSVHKNTFLQAGYGIYAYGTSGISAGGLDNWTIDSNTFGPSAYSDDSNFGYNAIFLYNMVNVSVANNLMQNIGTTSSSSQCVGVYMGSNVSGTIDHNTIKNVMSNNTGSGAGSTCAVYTGSGVANVTISNNVITAISDINTGGWGCRGIIINSSANSNTTIVNNMISDISSYSDNPYSYWPDGIDIEGSSGGVNVYFNSVNLFGSHSGLTSATGAACLFVNTSGNNIDVRDNIFSNSYDNTTSSSDQGFAVATNVGNSVFSNIDYNDYYTIAPDVLGRANGTVETTLSGMQSGFGGNVHSININPTYVSASDLHLQIIGDNIPLIAGLPLTGITTDIDGNTRNLTTPVMGANEVVIPGCFYIVAGTAVASIPAICNAALDTISLSGATQASGLSYQWEYSTDSTIFLPINGATNATYNAPLITATIYYRNVITCANSGLMDSSSVKVTVNPLPVISVTPNGGGYCSGAGSVSMTASGAATYTWSPAAGLDNTNTASVTASPLLTTVYTVTATDTNGCVNTHTDTVTVTQTPPPVVITPAYDTLCSGSSVLLAASASLPDSIMVQNFNSGLGAWTTDNTGSATYPGVQWKVVDDGFNEDASFNDFHSPDNSSFVVCVPDETNALTQSILITPAFSLSGYTSATVSFQMAYEHYINDQDVLLQISTDGGSTWTTIYDYMANGNVGNEDGFVNESYPLDAYIGQGNCKIRFEYYSHWGFYWAIDNFAITGTGSYNNISWAPGTSLFTDPGLTTAYAGGSADTVYSAPTAATETTFNYVATANNNGCTDTGSAHVTVLPALVVDSLLGGGSYCIGTAGIDLMLNQSTAGINYQLYNGTAAAGIVMAGTGNTIDFGPQTAAGTYYVVATNGYCSSTMVDSATIAITPLPVVGPITGTDSVCVNAVITLTDTTANGTWSSASAGTATISSAGIVTGVAAGADTIKYSLTNSCGTTTVDTVINVDALPAPVITASNISHLSTGTFTTYQWYLNDTAISGATGATYTATVNGNYTVYATNASGCGDTSVVKAVDSIGLGIANVGYGYGTDINIYPNPNTGAFVVSGSLAAYNNKAQMEIINVAGQVISRDDVEVSKGTIYKQVKMEERDAAGMYYIKITSDRQIVTLPFIKQ